MSISNPFTPEHELFRKSVREYVDKRLRPHAEEWEAKQIFPREVFKEMGELGFLGIRVPEEYGGSGLDYWYTVVFAEELTRSTMAGLNMSMLVQTDMATPIIWEIGEDYHKRNFGVPAMKGEAVAALGVSEPNAGSDVASIRTTARRDGDDYVINGQKTFITNGTRADFITLAVRTGGEGYAGLSLVMFPTDTKGFQVGRALKKIGNHTSDTAELFFEDCRIPAKNRLGEEGHGFYYIMRNFQGERLAAAIISVSGAQHIWDQTVAYAHDRKAFGRPIGSFQVWKHKLVEHLTSIEAARRLTYHACDLFNRKEEAIREITMAKLFAGDLLQRVVYDCQQLYGGWGYIEEFHIARAYRDVRLVTIGGGTSEIMKEILTKLALPDSKR
jgi:citronellyl-CoA dehydrogenase